jgi:hypothetical protein
VTTSASRAEPSARILLQLDARRLRASVRNPSVGPLLAILLPVALLAGILWVVGSTTRPAVADADAAVLMGLLLSGPLAFIAYTIIFRASDEPFLRRLGFSAPAIFQERASRFLLLSFAAAATAMIPFIAAAASESSRKRDARS